MLKPVYVGTICSKIFYKFYYNNNVILLPQYAVTVYNLFVRSTIIAYSK